MKYIEIDYEKETEYDWKLFTVEDYIAYKSILESMPYDPELAQFFHKQKREESKNIKREKRYYVDATLEMLDLIPARRDSEASELLECVLNVMTSVEKKRLLALSKGYTEEQIANLEGCTQQAVHCSIEHARKKAKKFSF